VRPALAGVLGALLLSLPVWAAPGSSQRPVIVELYTSEGCSSCPPAEALIEQMAKQTDVLPLAFHVDYWDDLGWRDRFSMKQATQRQQDLAHRLGASTVGTPQFIVEGRDSVWASNEAGLSRALKKPLNDAPLSAQREAKELVVRTPARPAGEVYDVYVVGYLPHTVTRIGRGENAGRTLTEVNVVRDIRQLGKSGNTAGEWKIPLSSFPADASRAVVFLQRSGGSAIAGARTVDLRVTERADYLRGTP
jgi:hypothetical protein